jgi:hypothetical protein
MYQLHEAMARERMRDIRDNAAQRRLASQASSARSWRLLAAYVARRAAKSEQRLAEIPSSEYDLAG